MIVKTSNVGVEIGMLVRDVTVDGGGVGIYVVVDNITPAEGGDKISEDVNVCAGGLGCVCSMPE